MFPEANAIIVLEAGSPRPYVRAMGEHEPRHKPTPPHLAIMGDGKDTFIVLDGVQIAKRGHAGTLQAGTWVSLEPGWSVIDNVGANELTVMFEDVRVH